MKIGSLCTGYGGLDMAAEAYFNAEMVWCAENDNESLNTSKQICVSCNDDRLLHDGQYLVCSQCHCRQ